MEESVKMRELITCAKCGESNANDARHCSSCGASLVGAKATSAEPGKKKARLVERLRKKA